MLTRIKLASLLKTLLLVQLFIALPSCCSKTSAAALGQLPENDTPAPGSSFAPGKQAVVARAYCPEKEIGLPQVVRLVESVNFGERKLGKQTLDQFACSLPVNPRFRKRAGVFVTLSYKGKTRACWGSIFPQQKSIVEETVFAAIGALTKEYRFPAVQTCEWKGLKPQVTVIRGVDPISGIRCQNPLRDGLLVRAGGKAGVLLPGEAVDAYYQLVQCKLKAGIKPGEPCQLYRLRTEIYE